MADYNDGILGTIHTDKEDLIANLSPSYHLLFTKSHNQHSTSFRILPLQSNPFISLDFLISLLEEFCGTIMMEGKPFNHVAWKNSGFINSFLVSSSTWVVAYNNFAGWFNDPTLFQRHNCRDTLILTIVIVSTTKINRSLITTLLQLSTYDLGMLCS